MTTARHVTQLALLLGSFACSLDERVLVSAAEASAGRSVAEGGDGHGYGGEAGAAGADETPRGGTGQGGNGGRGGLVDGCADLDTDGVGDCTVTLVTTPSFASDVEGWTAVGDAELSWDPKNALSDQPSGSAKLSGRATFVKATQCVPIEGPKLVIAYASAFIETTEEAEGAHALLEVSFFASDDCSGLSEGFFETPPSRVLDAWTTIHAGSVSMTTTRSVSVTLTGVRAGAATSQGAYFDNVMLAAKEL